MTEGEALQALKLEGGFEICGRATRVAEFLKGLDIVEKAIKKQVEMQPIRDYNNDVKKNWCSCPACKTGLGWELCIQKMKYCYDCGQKLDWKTGVKSKE